ncbi:MAG: endonuclease/exonuclease/phosphatase family protein [Eubacterium sp.]|nr:endonuclease/exonuclease/phosphatase family protein [Eubacterium sp.]
MKRVLICILSVFMIMGLFSGCSKTEYPAFDAPNKGNIRVVSYNCAAPWGNFIKGTGSSTRVKKFAQYINSVKPDSIGTQEMNQDWLDNLASLLSDYDSYGVIRGGDENEKKSEMNAVFWLKEKYTVEAKDTFWLSETPDEESKFEGAGCYRVCTWVLLTNNETGEQYIHMNTHLDNKSEDAANYGATVIADKIDELRSIYGAPIVLSGDFNEFEGMAAYNTIADELQETRLVAKETETKTTYQAWGDVNTGKPIDFIFTDKGLSVAQYKVLDDTSNGYVSDHNGIMADFSVSE